MKEKWFIIFFSVLAAGLIVILTVPSGKSFGKKSEIFQLSKDDEFKISKEFITKIRSAVGDRNASRASSELYKYVLGQIYTASVEEREDFEVSYINYLDRLYKQALNAALEKMSPGEKSVILKKENEWEQNLVESYDYEIKDKNGDCVFGCVAARLRHIRLVHNRAKYWECSPERRAEIDSFQGLKIRCISGEHPVEFNELRRVTPISLHAEPVNSKEKTYIEDIASFPLDFCRARKVGNDIYHIGILIPNNDISFERSTQGYERILVIWKNRQFYAHYSLPVHAEIRSLEISGTRLTVKYIQTDEFSNRDKRKNNPEQTFTIDYTYEIFAPVKITNWLNYFMDGVGNIHKNNCCGK